MFIKNYERLEAKVGQKSLTWIRLIMISYNVPWWPSWLSNQIAVSNLESDVVWSASRLTLPPSWIFELHDFNHSESACHAIKFWLNLTHGLGGDVVWRIHGSHFGYWNKTILAILNFHKTTMPPIKLRLCREQVWFEDFQDGWHGGHLRYKNGTILAILNLNVAPTPPFKFQLHPTYELGDVVFEEFQDGHRDSRLGYRNGTILAILNPHVSPVPPIKFRLNMTYTSGADAI